MDTAQREELDGGSEAAGGARGVGGGVLRPDRSGRDVRAGGGGDRRVVQGAGRSAPCPRREPAGGIGRVRLRVRPHRDARPLAADGELPHEEARGRRAPGSRAAGCVGVLLAARRRRSPARRGPEVPRRGEAMNDLREEVRERYAEAARSVKEGKVADDWHPEVACGPECCAPHEGLGVQLYDAKERENLPDEAVLASLGCGNPTAVADLREG